MRVRIIKGKEATSKWMTVEELMKIARKNWAKAFAEKQPSNNTEKPDDKVG